MISEKRWKSLKSYGSAQQLSNQVSSKCNGHLSLMREPTATIKMGDASLHTSKTTQRSGNDVVAQGANSLRAAANHLTQTDTSYLCAKKLKPQIR